MASSSAVTKARGACQYRTPEGLPPLPTSEARPASQDTLDHEAIGKALESAENLSQLILEEERRKLSRTWKCPIDSDVVKAVEALGCKVDNVSAGKETCLSSLRNPAAASSENGLPLRRDRQGAFVEAVNILGELAKNKEDNKANSRWVENQDWTKFGADLTGVANTLMCMEAGVASKLSDIKQRGEGVL